MIAGCYRRDEAQNPEQFAAALALVLGDYDSAIIDYIADPRTGASAEFPMGLPNVGQIRKLCERAVERQAILSAPDRPRPVAFKPPALLPGQVDYNGFLRLVAEGKTASRPIGRFERTDGRAA